MNTNEIDRSTEYLQLFRYPLYTVSEITYIIKNTLLKEPLLNQIYIKGEISNFKKHHLSSHMYFVLKDKDAKIQCVMFREDNQYLKFLPYDGLTVIAFGSVSVYEKEGIYQFYVREMQPEGIGALYVAFEKLKEKLRREGLFDEARKKKIPSIPQKIAILTSLTGAAIFDILTTINKRFPNLHIIIIPTIVQGDGSEQSIIEAIKLANQIPKLDVIILARGGGSIEELWSFNSEEVARSIAASSVPIVTGIGHETDFTIADFVADFRCATPTAAAQFITPDKEELENKLINFTNRLNISIKRNIENKKLILDGLRKRLRSPQEIIKQNYQTLDNIYNRLNIIIKHMLQLKKENIENLENILHSLSPLRVLDRGYSIFRRLKDKKVIYSIKDAQVKDETEVIVKDGKFICEIMKKEQL